jgi:hypothetical protein
MLTKAYLCPLHFELNAPSKADSAPQHEQNDNATMVVIGQFSCFCSEQRRLHRHICELADGNSTRTPGLRPIEDPFS